MSPGEKEEEVVLGEKEEERSIHHMKWMQSWDFFFLYKCLTHWVKQRCLKRNVLLHWTQWRFFFGKKSKKKHQFQVVAQWHLGTCECLWWLILIVPLIVTFGGASLWPHKRLVHWESKNLTKLLRGGGNMGGRAYFWEVSLQGRAFVSWSKRRPIPGAAPALCLPAETWPPRRSRLKCLEGANIICFPF